MSTANDSNNRSCCVSMSGFAVECGWAIGEAIMIPHLLGLRLSAALAGLIYLVNPIFSVVLATLVGNWSDRCTRCNRRHPFILAFAVLAVLGFGFLLFSPYLTNLPVQIMVVYLSFGIADLSHDLMLIPGRALLIDMLIDDQARKRHAATGLPDVTEAAHTTPAAATTTFSLSTTTNRSTPSATPTPPQHPQQQAMSVSSELQADSMYNEMQNWGRLFGLAVVSFPVEELLSTSLKWTHFQTSLGFSIVVLVTCTGIVFCSSRDRPYDPLLSPKLDATVAPTNIETPFLLNAVAVPTTTTTTTRHNSSVPEPQPSKTTSKLTTTQTIDLGVVLFITFVIWFGISTFCFWSTSWLGLDTNVPGTRFSLPLVAMALQTSVGILISRVGIVRGLNGSFGHAPVWLVSGVLYMVVLGCCCFLGPDKPIITLVVLMFGGIHYGIHGSNVYVIVRDIVDDEDKTGWAISMACTTLPVAQILVSVLLGLMVDCSINVPVPPSGGNTTLAPSSSMAMNGLLAVIGSNLTMTPLATRTHTVVHTNKRVVCPEVGSIMFKWVGFVGASLIVLLYGVDVCCLKGRTFGGRRKGRRGSLEKRSPGH